MKVGILGATGAVGQTFVALLQDHPYFQITAVAASERSAGKRYADAVHWIGSQPIPAAIADMPVVEAAPGLDCDLVFSGLDANVAGDIEAAFAQAGYPVISNAKNYRMHPQVPLLIPEVNPDHTALVTQQDWGGSGYIVTNPNCATVGLVCALKPLHDAFGVEAVHVVTMQAVSGAGYPGVASLDILSNVIPYIGGEEDKLVTEPRKLLGTLTDGAVADADVRIAAQCTRVPTLNGHLEAVSVKLKTPATPEAAVAAMRGFRSAIDDLHLPSAPRPLLHVFDDPRYPQPRRHVDYGHGMQVTVGRVRPCELFDLKFFVLSHNTIRGAAGGAILNAELLVAQGMLKARR